jgi:hypothetical protein
MIYVAAEELEDAFHLFTVMNTRGIKLRNSDILKVENLAQVVDATTRTEYAKKWKSIEEYFEEDFDNFLSHLRTILVKQRANYNLLKEYEYYVYASKEFDPITKTYNDKTPLLTKGKSTFDFIERYSKHYRDLFDDDNYNLTNSYEFCNQLELMRFTFQADYWVAPLLCYYENYKTGGLLEFLYLLDRKFSSDWIIGLSPTRRIQNINEIIKEIETATSQKCLFASPVFKVETQELLRRLSEGIYGRAYCRYILLKIDLAYHGHTTKFSIPRRISTEHILPQTPDPKSDWVRDFTEEDREKWTDRLGNLILLSRPKNSSQGRLDYPPKKDNYFKGNIELFSNSVRILNTFHFWKLTDLKKNHKETLIKLLSPYGIIMSDGDLERAVE